MTRRERDLLDLGEEVARIPVQRETSDGPKGKSLLTPRLGDVERVELECLRLLHRHHLDEHVPLGVVTLGDGIEQVADGIVGIRSRQLSSSSHVDVLDVLSCPHVEFAVNCVALARLELERVTSVAVHEAEAVWNAAIAVEKHHLVGGLGSEGDEVPVHVGVLQVRLRIALLAVDEAREEEWIADEEDRRVVAHQIPDAVFGVELHGEASRISHGVGTAALTSDGRETHRNRRSLANLVEDLRGGEFGDVVRDFEVAESSAAFGMFHSLRNALAVKVSHCVEEVDVLEQDWPARSNCRAEVNESLSEKHIANSPVIVAVITPKGAPFPFVATADPLWKRRKKGKRKSFQSVRR